MNKRFTLLSLFVIAAMVFPGLVGAQEPETLPGTGWWTGQQIQNVGTQNATIMSTAYSSTNAGESYTAQYGPLAPGASKTFLPSDFTGMPNGFQGSAVVSSDQPIKAIVSLINRFVPPYGTPGGLAAGQYQGIDGAAASTTIRFPIAKHCFPQSGVSCVSATAKTSTFFVQNAGQAPTTVVATYNCSGVLSTSTSASIQPGQMVVINPSATLTINSNCSATMSTVTTGNQPIAGVGSEHFHSESVATLVQAVRGFTTSDQSTTIYAPIYKKRFPLGGGGSTTTARSTGAQVQNVSGGPLVITATYFPSGGTCPAGGPSVAENSPSIADGAAHVFLHPVGLADGCLASAQFTATGAIVGVINESFLSPVPPPGTQSSTAYNTLPNTVATHKISIPLYKEKFGNKSTGLQVQNVDTTAASIVLEFRSGANLWTTNAIVAQPGASLVYYLVSDPGQIGIWNGPQMPAGTNAGVTVLSDKNVLANAVESTYPLCFGGSTCYDRLNYEGFNLPN